MKTAQKRSDALEKAVDVFDDKWTALLINELMKGSLPFCHLEKELVGISPRTLSARLDRLEANRIITRRLYCTRPPRYRYGLTKKGRDLDKVLKSMSAWGAKH